MKLWTLSTLCAASLLILSGCTTTPKPPKELKVDNSLPQVELTRNGVITDMKTVAFEWKSIKDPRVEGVYIFKENYTHDAGSKFNHFATITNRFQTHYLDQDLQAETKYNYMFRTFSKDAQSRPSKIVTATTLPVLSSVSWIHSITGMPRSAKLIWRPHSSERVSSYVIERKTLQEQEWKKLNTIKGRLNAEYIDEGLDDNYVYMYRVRVLTYDGILSSPSLAVKSVTKALPHSVLNIRTTNNLAKKIKIEWDASTQKDFEVYHVYRSGSIDGTYELIAKLKNSNSFVDALEEDGASYFYRVSVVDKDGLESEHEKNSIHGMSRVKPEAPAMVKAKYMGNTIELAWNRADKRAETFIVDKTQTQGWFDKSSETYEGIKKESFRDTNILPNSQYTYRVYSVDKDGVTSKPSIEVKIKTPESKKLEKAPLEKTEKEVRVAPKADTTQEIIAPMENLDLSEI